MSHRTRLKYIRGSYFRSRSHEYFPSLLQIPNIIIGQNLKILAIVVRAAKIRHASLCVIIAEKSSHHLCIFCSLIEVAKELSVSQVLYISLVKTGKGQVKIFRIPTLLIKLQSRLQK